MNERTGMVLGLILGTLFAVMFQAVFSDGERRPSSPSPISVVGRGGGE